MKKLKSILINISFIAIGLTILSVGFIFKNQFEHKTITSSSYLKQVKPSLKNSEEDENKDEETNGPAEFAKFHQLIRTKWGESAPTYTNSYKQKELKKAQQNKSMLKSATDKLDWIERGPGNISGRVRGIIIDPDDPSCDTWFIGSASGGIWKTSDAGGSWRNLTPEIQNLGTSTLAMAASNTNVIYAGTGEVFYGTLTCIGDGIIKSTDKGETWKPLISTTVGDDFKYVNRIIVDPNNEDIVLAATKTSIQKSIDGGENWLNVYNSPVVVHQILANPDDFNILYATCSGEGILKSVDAGENWIFCLKGISGRVEMAIAPSNPEIIYANDELAHVFVSKNSGDTWSICETTSLNTTFNKQNGYNNALAVSPENPDRALIGCIDLYQLDINGVADDSINLISTYSENIESFMGFYNYRQKYLNGSMQINPEKTNFKTIEIQFGPGKAQKAHRFLVPNGRTSGVADSSHTFTDYVEVPFEVWDIENQRQLMVSFRDQDRNGVFNLYSSPDYSTICREYIWVHDVNYSETSATEIAQNGGHKFENIFEIWPILPADGHWNADSLPDSKIGIIQTPLVKLDFNFSPMATNYSWDFPEIKLPYIHADLHNIQIVQKQDQTHRIVVANDGGVCFSDDDGVTWQKTLNGCNTTQCYGVDKHPRLNRYMVGIQDNYSLISPENPNQLSKWSVVSGGDGFDAVWNAQNPDKIITSYQYNNLMLSTNGGQTSHNITLEIEDNGTVRAPFITQIGYSKNDPDKVYIGGKSGVTISKDFGLSWKVTAIPDDTWRWSSHSYVEPSLIDPDIVWAATEMTNRAKIHVSIDGGESFTATQNYKESLGYLSGLAVHPIDRNTAYALFSIAGYPKILRTNNLGQSWEDISGFENGESNNGFPDVAVYSLIVMPHNPNEIWVGTEIGLFISTNNGESWKYAGNGLPSISIWDIKLRGNQVVIASYGRGVWTLDLPGLPSTSEYPTITNAGTIPSNKTNVQFCLNSVSDSVRFLIDKEHYFKIKDTQTIGEIQTKTFDLNLAEGRHDISIEAYKDGNVMPSFIISFYVIRYNESQFNYNNDFVESSNDFESEGEQFSVYENTALGEGMALHTAHHYPANGEFSCYLKTPIIISANNEIISLSYQDIPLIEAGEKDSKFGNNDFYDYVIVEASIDGFAWKPLCDGYDYLTVKELTENLGKNIDSEPSSEQFIEHNINLSDQFDEGDTLMFRFRLFSDANTTGWGWVIDNIDIQSKKTSKVNLATLVTSIYPIPCSNQLNIEMNTNIDEKIQLTVYDLNGRKMLTQSFVNQSQIVLNTSGLKSTNYLLEIRCGKYVQRKKFQVSR